MSEWNTVFGGAGFVALDEADPSAGWDDLPGGSVVDQFQALPDALLPEVLLPVDDDLVVPRARRTAQDADEPGDDQPDGVADDDSATADPVESSVPDDDANIERLDVIELHHDEGPLTWVAIDADLDADMNADMNADDPADEPDDDVGFDIT